MSINIEETERAARALLDSRITSVRTLVDARQKHLDIQAQIADAERHHLRAYQAALRDGWSADELRKLGLAEPDKLPRQRRRQPKPTDPSPTT